MKRRLSVVPVEVSGDSEAAVLYALAVSKQMDADVPFLVVRPPPRLILTASGDAQSRLTSVLRTARAQGVSAKGVIKDGRPLEVIPAYAQLEGATWMVLAESTDRDRCAAPLSSELWPAGRRALCWSCLLNLAQMRSRKTSRHGGELRW